MSWPFKNISCFITSHKSGILTDILLGSDHQQRLIYKTYSIHVASSPGALWYLPGSCPPLTVSYFLLLLTHCLNSFHPLLLPHWLYLRVHVHSKPYLPTSFGLNSDPNEMTINISNILITTPLCNYMNINTSNI